MSGAVERGRADVGLPVPRIALQAERRGHRRAGGIAFEERVKNRSSAAFSSAMLARQRRHEQADNRFDHGWRETASRPIPEIFK